MRFIIRFHLFLLLMHWIGGALRPCSCFLTAERRADVGMLYLANQSDDHDAVIPQWPAHTLQATRGVFMRSPQFPLRKRCSIISRQSKESVDEPSRGDWRKAIPHWQTIAITCALQDPGSDYRSSIDPNATSQGMSKHSGILISSAPPQDSKLIRIFFYKGLLLRLIVVQRGKRV